MEAATESRNTGLGKMVVGALLGILALLFYLFLGSRSETLEVQKQLTFKVEEIASVHSQLDSIALVLDKKIVELRQLGGNVKQLEQIRQQLEEDKKKLSYDLSFSLQQYHLKINDYTSFLRRKEEEIQRFKAENGLLISRAQRLEQEKRTILEENQGLKQQKEELAQQVEEVSQQNAELQDQVTLASSLKAVNVTIHALTSSGRERNDGPYKANRIDRLKISFILPSNPVATKGDKDIYLRILDENGAVISDSGIGGTRSFEGKELGYSLRQTVSYENNDQPVDILFRRQSAYAPGAYSVELYADGVKIGESQFQVK